MENGRWCRFFCCFGLYVFSSGQLSVLPATPSVTGSTRSMIVTLYTLPPCAPLQPATSPPICEKRSDSMLFFPPPAYPNHGMPTLTASAHGLCHYGSAVVLLHPFHQRTGHGGDGDYRALPGLVLIVCSFPVTAVSEANESDMPPQCPARFLASVGARSSQQMVPDFLGKSLNKETR